MRQEDHDPAAASRPRAGPGFGVVTLRCLAVGLLASCGSAAYSSTTDRLPPESAYDRAVELSSASDHSGAMDALRVALEAGADAYQRALLAPAFHEGLRDTEEFRDTMHRAAVGHRVSSLTLVGADEPGEWIEIDGRTVDATGEAVAGATIRVFHTDAAGRYHPQIDGERLPRIFGTLVSDPDGRFSFRTVRPGPYPGTRNAIHVHISARAGSLRLAAPHYAVFDDDPLLLEPQNSEQRGEAIRIEMEDAAVDGVRRGTIVLPMR